MINWDFNPNNVEDREFEPLPIGDYRVRIEDVEEGKKNFPYYKLTLKVSGDNRKLWFYLTFMTGIGKDGSDLKKRTDTNLSNIWNSFDIPIGELDYAKWIGKVGAVRVKHDTYNGEPQAKISYFIKRENQKKLPAWSEDAPTIIDDDFTLMEDDDEIPF